MIIFILGGQACIAISSFYSNPVRPDQVQAIIMLCVSALTSSIYSVFIKESQIFLKKRNIHVHPTETAFFIMGYASLVMIVLSLIIELQGWPDLFHNFTPLSNMILVTLLGGCVMTTGDKLAGIFLTMRNSLVDWSIIADSKQFPRSSLTF
ncbi:EamA-like_transporter family protein [Hexamita inflata]|nr:EamA-like transporter family protein [Hexamita inflata]